MEIERRGFLALAGRAGTLLIGAGFGAWTRRARAVTESPLALRRVASADAAGLQAIMTSCVADAGAFFGKCGEWSLGWAQELIARCPDTVVLQRDGDALAFLEIPPIRPPGPAPADDASSEARASHAVRERNRTTFRVTAAGVRDDLISAGESVALFQTLLVEGLTRARELGYETVEAIAPWERHPRLEKKWTDYPGCELVEPPSVSPVDGKALYWLRWRPDDAIPALAADSAAHHDVSLRERFKVRG